MRSALTLSVIGVALCFAASPSHAVGFGRVSNATQLGQPLNFVAGVRLEPDELLPRECVSAEVQSGDNKLQPQQIRATLEGADDSQERSIRVTTSALIDEPVVTVSVTLGCSAKVTRRFVVFIDPPLIDAPRTAQIEPPLPPQRIDSQVAPIVAIVQGSAQRTAPRPRSRAPAPVSVASTNGDSRDATADKVPSPVKPRRAAAPRQANAAHAASGPRLQLEAAPAATVIAAAAAASAPVVAPLATGAAPAASDAASAAQTAEAANASAKDHQRIQSLEESVAKMHSDSQATQASLAALQARLQQAESERYANPMVYALAWLSALLALALAGLWWRQSHGRHAPQWWAGPAASGARPAAVAEPVVSAPQPLGSPNTAADAFDASTVVEEDDMPPAHTSATRPAPFVTSALAPITLSPEPPRELSVEELIDLEQQAEFFIVLGQDEAAIELLMSHVRSDGGISPLPYLKLLEIYRRRGDDEAYQRIRERFNRRFNAYAPDWESDPQQGRSLVDYPDTIARLQGLWSSPARVMGTLDASLFRRNRTDETFDLPAYRELLFLYSIARDLAEHAGVLPTTSVDLLLPLDDPGEEPISRLTATTQAGDFQTSDLMTMPLDLDVTFGPGNTQDVETMPSALRRSSELRSTTDSNFLDFDLDTPPAPKPKAGGNR